MFGNPSYDLFTLSISQFFFERCLQFLPQFLLRPVFVYVETIQNEFFVIKFNFFTKFWYITVYVTWCGQKILILLMKVNPPCPCMVVRWWHRVMHDVVVLLVDFDSVPEECLVHNFQSGKNIVKENQHLVAEVLFLRFDLIGLIEPLCTVVQAVRGRENCLLISSSIGVWDCSVGAPLVRSELDSAGLVLVVFTVLTELTILLTSSSKLSIFSFCLFGFLSGKFIAGKFQ